MSALLLDDALKPATPLTNVAIFGHPAVFHLDPEGLGGVGRSLVELWSKTPSRLLRSVQRIGSAKG